MELLVKQFCLSDHQNVYVIFNEQYLKLEHFFLSVSENNIWA